MEETLKAAERRAREDAKKKGLTKEETDEAVRDRREMARRIQEHRFKMGRGSEEYAAAKKKEEDILRARSIGSKYGMGRTPVGYKPTILESRPISEYLPGDSRRSVESQF